MFGRLETSSPSRCAAVRPSASAARRPGRESTTDGYGARQASQRELVAVGAETADDSNRRGREHRLAALGLACIDVRQVHLDERHIDRRQRVTNRDRGVSVGAGVDHDAVDPPAQSVNGVDELSLAVVLREFEHGSDAGSDRAQRTLDVVQRFMAIQLWFARPEQVQIRAIQDGDPHVFFLSPSSQALNCAMSSVESDAGAGAGAAPPGFADAAGFDSSAKNCENEKFSASPLDRGGAFDLKTWSSDNSSVARRAGAPLIGSGSLGDASASGATALAMAARLLTPEEGAGADGSACSELAPLNSASIDPDTVSLATDVETRGS